MRARIPSPSRWLSLRIQIIILVALIAFPALGLLVYTGAEQREADAKTARERAIDASREVGSGYNSVIGATQAFTQPIAGLLSETTTLESISESMCVEFLSGYLGSESVYASVQVVLPDGTVWCATQPLTTTISFAESSLFREAREATGPIVGPFQIDPLTQRRVLPVAQPLTGAENERIGVLYFMIDVNALNLAPAVEPLPEGSFATIVDREGVIIARFPDRPDLVGTNISESDSFAEIREQQQGALDTLSADGTEALIGYSPIAPGGGAFVLVGTPRASAYADANAALQRNLILLGVVTLYVMALGWLGTNRIIIRPLRQVVDVADRIEAGDRSARVGPVYGVGEIAGLGRAFDEMADAVDQREADIDELNASLERRVEERTEELLAANSELESFSYTVSHDLRAPLRAIDGFSELLQAKYQSDLPEEAQRFVDRIRTGAVRMGSLIDDLLQFSRLTRVDLARRPVSLDALVKEVIDDDFQSAATGRQIAWRIGQLGTVPADPAMLRHVLVNLIGNAVKFSRDRSPVIVEIGRTEVDGETTYFVRDNGVGFDMAHATHMFGVFQRLHLQEEFEGTGIGLAIVERIVHRHDGRVWAESAPDQGATFFFTLGTPSMGGTA